jgi:hypothetical protein
MSAHASKRALTAYASVNFRRPKLNFQDLVTNRATAISLCVAPGRTLQQIGHKTLRTPTATLTLADASLKAIPVAPEDIPARWWKPQPPKGWNAPRSEPTSTHSNQLRPPSETLPQWLALARSV